MADCFQGFKNQESIMEKGIYEYIYISAFDDPFETILCRYTDRKNVTNFLYLVLHLARKVTCYFRLFSSVLVSVLRTSIYVLPKSKSRNYVTWIANLTKLFLSVYGIHQI